MYTLEKINTSPLQTLCTLVPQIIPLPALISVQMWYEESTPGNIRNFAPIQHVWLDPPRDILAIEVEWAFQCDFV